MQLLELHLDEHGIWQNVWKCVGFLCFSRGAKSDSYFGEPADVITFKNPSGFYKKLKSYQLKIWSVSTKILMKNPIRNVSCAVKFLYVIAYMNLPD